MWVCDKQVLTKTTGVSTRSIVEGESPASSADRMVGREKRPQGTEFAYCDVQLETFLYSLERESVMRLLLSSAHLLQES